MKQEYMLNSEITVPWDKFGEQLHIWLGIHHSCYVTKCKAEYLEELTKKALEDIGIKSDWKADNNHGIGKDQTLYNGLKISNKSGMFMKDKIKISGSRTSKHLTFEDKLNFISEYNYDYIVGCATDNKKNNKYYMYVINKNQINYKDMHWKENIDKNGKKKWSGTSDGIKAEISTDTTSGQLWTTIDIELCDFFKELDIAQIT